MEFVIATLRGLKSHDHYLSIVFRQKLKNEKYRDNERNVY